MFVIPSEFSSAFAKLGDALAGEARTGAVGDNGRGEDEPGGPRFLPRPGAREREDRIADQAAADAEEAARGRRGSGPRGVGREQHEHRAARRSALPSGETPPNGVPERE